MELKYYRLEQYVDISKLMEGTLAEVGVWQGRSAHVIASRKRPDQKFYMFDTFEGMPEVSEYDNYHKKGDYASNFDAVKSQFQRYDNTFIYKGIFPNENSDIVKDEKFALVHIDVDIYQSYKDCLSFFYPRMIEGGLIVMDEYAASTCLGAKVATDEFLKDKPEKVRWIVDNCQAVIIKD
jgi:hypothetical protein